MKKKSKRVEENLSKIMTYLKGFVDENGFSPSYRDISYATSIKSTNSVKKYMDILEERELIKRNPEQARSLSICKVYDEDANKNDTITVPLLGEIAAGLPILAQQEITDYFTISKNMFKTSENLYLLHIVGNSMVDAGIYNGDYVVVKQQNDATNGSIVVALVEDSATVKTIFKENGHIRLQPQNTNYPPIIVDDCQILGIVVGLIRKFN